MGKKLGWILLGIGAVILVWLVWVWATLDDFNAQRQQAAEQKRSAGLAQGALSDQQACLESALQQFANCDESAFICTVDQGIYLKACLEVAAPSADFCTGVPAYHEKAEEEEKEWARHSCWAREIRGEGCRLLLRQQQLVCAQERDAPF